MNRAIRVVVLSCTLGGCAGGENATDVVSGPDSGTPLAPAHERLDCDLPTVIEYCGGSTCHYDNAALDVASGLVLWDRAAGQMPDDVHTRLVGVPATYHNVANPELCPPVPELLIDPTNVEQSLVLGKLAGTQQCGAEMPKFPYPEWGTVANPGPQREGWVQCIREWVALLAEDSKRTP